MSFNHEVLSNFGKNVMYLRCNTAIFRAVLLGFLTLLVSTQVPFPNKISCFVIPCVSLDNSFPSIRQEPSFGPWKGSTFLQQHSAIPLSTDSIYNLLLTFALSTSFTIPSVATYISNSQIICFQNKILF